jgi:hypothetical protein
VAGGFNGGGRMGGLPQQVGGGRQQFGLDYQASVPVVQSPYDANYWGGPRSQPAGIPTDMWNLMGAGGGGNASLGGDPAMGMSSGMGGGDPAMASKRKLPPWMQQPGSPPGASGLPPGLLGGGYGGPGTPSIISQLSGGQGGGQPLQSPYPGQLFGGGGGGAGPSGLAMLGAGGGGAGGGGGQQLPPWMQQGGAGGGGYAGIGTIPQGPATAQLFGGGAPSGPPPLQSPFPGQLFGGNNLGQFNPASRNLPAYLQNLFGRGRRGNR